MTSRPPVYQHPDDEFIVPENTTDDEASERWAQFYSANAPFGEKWSDEFFCQAYHNIYLEMQQEGYDVTAQLEEIGQDLASYAADRLAVQEYLDSQKESVTDKYAQPEAPAPTTEPQKEPE